MKSPTFGAPASFPIRALRLGIAAMVALMIASIALTWRVGQNIRKELRSQIEVITATQKVAHYGAILELSIKAVVANGDAEAAARYQTIQPALRQILIDLRRSLAGAHNEDAVASVDEADLALIAMEYQALDLATSGELQGAREIVDSQRYDYLVNVYQQGVGAIEKDASRFVAETRSRLDFLLWIIIALSGVSLTLVILGWVVFIRPVRRWGSEIEVARASAERSATELEAKQQELEILNRRLFKQARIDPLTGLATRLSFNEEAPQWLLTDITPHKYCAVMCDIDFFKQFNDSQGHLAGDQALQLVAEAIRDSLGREDRAYRLGGEEFLVVMKCASARSAGARADRIRRAVAELGLSHRESPLGSITISMGVAALARPAGMSIERWLSQADEALYAAKSGGRNQVALAPACKKEIVRLATGRRAATTG